MFQWCVENLSYPTKEDWQKAEELRKESRKAKIAGAAIGAPCSYLWYILHTINVSPNTTDEIGILAITGGAVAAAGFVQGHYKQIEIAIRSKLVTNWMARHAVFSELDQYAGQITDLYVAAGVPEQAPTEDLE